MNERIEELSLQAKKYAMENFGTDFGLFYRLYEQKFAELIVRECVDVCDKMYHDRYPDAEEWERSEEGDAIKQHFGVEE